MYNKTSKNYETEERCLISLFDYSGLWAKPFWDAGWNVIQLDIKTGNDLNQFQSIEDVFDWGINEAHGIIAAPPCTDFSVSGAQYWPKKDANGTTAQAIELVRQVQRFANLFTPTDDEYDKPFFWAMENPVGRIQSLFPELGKPYYFHPNEFAGYLDRTDEELIRLSTIRLKNGQGVTREETDFVVDCEAYTKKTGLWGNFNRALIKNSIQPVKCAPQGSFTQRLGGKSDKTKEERSHTPLGFATAFFEANHEWMGYRDDEIIEP